MAPSDDTKTSSLFQRNISRKRGGGVEEEEGVADTKFQFDSEIGTGVETGVTGVKITAVSTVVVAALTSRWRRSDRHRHVSPGGLTSAEDPATAVTLLR